MNDPSRAGNLSSRAGFAHAVFLFDELKMEKGKLKITVCQYPWVLDFLSSFIL
jgi:hypothetical protein